MSKIRRDILPVKLEFQTWLTSVVNSSTADPTNLVISPLLWKIPSKIISALSQVKTEHHGCQEDSSLKK